MIPVVRLPDLFVKLMKMRVQQKSTDFQKIVELIQSRPDLSRFILKILSEDDRKQGIAQLLQHYGWQHFRNLLASLYIARAQYGRYPEFANIELVIDLLDFEERFRPYSAQTYSRSFLLAFYLKLASIEAEKQHKKFPKAFRSPPLEVSRILEWRKNKNVEVDWLILTLWNFANFIPFEQVNELKAMDRLSYKSLYGRLLPNQQKLMFECMLAYGCSIQEPDFFLKRV